MLHVTPPTLIQFEAASPLVLIVDEDGAFSDDLSRFLSSRDYQVETATDKAQMRSILRQRPVSLVVLGSLGPAEDSVLVCRGLAKPGGPAIVMLSPLTDVTDRIIALELGADDFLPRTCNPRELLARLRAIFRRRVCVARDAVISRRQFSGWRFDLLRRELFSPSGALIKLTSNEFSLLQAFTDNPQKMLSRDYLVARTGDPKRAIYNRAISVQVSRLRRKLYQGGRSPELIRTLRGKGYVFNSLISAF